MKMKYFLIGMACVTLSTPMSAFSQSNVDCPVQSPYPISYEEAFGNDVFDGLRCNKRRSQVRMVMQVNAFEQGGRPYGFRNLPNIVKDLELTHGIDNWRIAIIVHSGGNPFVIEGNTYQDMIEEYIDNPNVDIYYCLNTAYAKGHTTDDIIDGVKFVPAGLSSIMDFQYQGYKYIQP